MIYYLMNDGCVMRDSDKAVIPPNEKNPDWVQYQRDVQRGATVLPFDYTAEEARQAESENQRQAETARVELVEIDIRSIRAIREYIAAQPDAPEVLKQRETEALAARSKVTRGKA